MNYLDLQFPPITITADDLLHLSTIGLSITDAADFLVHEIDRARIIPAHQASPDLVRMGSIVKYRDNISGQAREVTLVYPHDANGNPNHLSVLTTVGAALIGLSVGQTIEFTTPVGKRTSLTVMSV